MYKRILIATDGSALAGKAETQGFSLAKELHASVIVATVTEPWFVAVRSLGRLPHLRKSRSRR
jgi:nucleotide-binding universal stress UspA family protein